MTEPSKTPRTDALRKNLYVRYPGALELLPAQKLDFYMEAAESYGQECSLLETALTVAQAENERLKKEIGILRSQLLGVRMEYGEGGNFCSNLSAALDAEKLIGDAARSAK